VVARAMEQEITGGKGFEGGTLNLDLRELGEELIDDRLPGIRQIAMDFAGVDPVKEPIPVQPAQHYSMGGIDVDIRGTTPVSGLYAAGECACISVHGANRLGGNSLLETVVFGRLVADAIVEDLPALSEPSLETVKAAMQETDSLVREILGRPAGVSLFDTTDQLKQVMTGKFGIFRDGRSMREGLAEIKILQAQLSHVSPANRERAVNQALIRYFELDGMLLLAEVVALGALAREESRGSHTRIDHPSRDDARFLKHTLASRKDGEVRISYKPVTMGMFEPEERVY
jgi:succinate dehydrogenase / fumarate reductase flavoprotein subunit